MGIVSAEIELTNGDDLAMVRRKLMGEEEIKRMYVTVLVDTGTMYLCINENIQGQLQLPVMGMRKGQLANGHIVEYPIVGPVEVRFKNRRCSIDAMVLPEDNEPLLGVIPLEDMDILVDPLRQELIVNPAHPDMAQGRI